MNIILIGMPGSGKTTIGKEISEDFDMNFLDMDAHIEKLENCGITDIFAEKGEAYFREKETELIKSFSDMENTVIATGGGVILKEGNMTMLKALGKIVFINRSVEDILESTDFEERPLLKKDPSKIHELYEARIALYKKYCDIEVSVTKNQIKSSDLTCLFEETAADS